VVAAPAAQQATVVVVRLVEVHAEAVHSHMAEVHVEADRSHMAEADPMVVVHTEDMVA
jgi:hypothetical protein